MGVGCGDQDTLERDAGGLGGESLRLIAHVTRNHATVHHRDGDGHVAPFQNKTASLEIPGVHFAAPTFQKSTADEERVEGRRDILNERTCFELGLDVWGVLCGQIEPESQQAGKNCPEKSVASEEGGFSAVAYHGVSGDWSSSDPIPKKDAGQNIVYEITLKCQPGHSGSSISNSAISTRSFLNDQLAHFGVEIGSAIRPDILKPRHRLEDLLPGRL